VRLRGSCLCKSVCYEVDGFEAPIEHCHCMTCRKAHAAVFASTVGVTRQKFRWIAGEDKLRAYESSPGKLRRFCRRCGTQLVAERAGKEHILLRVATLDDDPGKTRALHIWTSHEPSWLKDSEKLPRYAEWQPGRS
jgi:hypothetical protein